MVLCLCLIAAGCGGGDVESLDHFRLRWQEAVNSRDDGRLYDMLDSRSRRRIATDVEHLRSIESKQARDAVINQLGGERLESLVDLTPRDYFARVWHLATDGRRPTMTVEKAGEGTAYMWLTIDDTRRQRIRLEVEAGRWVWTLPEQQFNQPQPATDPASSARAPDPQ